MTTRTYNVPEISCDHCKRAIEGQVGEVADVSEVTVDVETKTVTVIGGQPSAVEQAIEAAGYAIG